MTSEAQRIAIAEACGWTGVHCSPKLSVSLYDKLVGTNPDESKRANEIFVPDYPSDLNAMHEAEKVFDNDEIKWNEYVGWILRMSENWRHEVNATAAQRAEAFLHTIGKWDDTK